MPVLPDHGRALLGIDVGGTTAKVRLVTPAGAVHERRVPTTTPDPDARALARSVVELVRWAEELAGEVAVGLVVPGVVDARAGVAVLSVNLGWQAVPVLAQVRAALAADGRPRPVAFGQDVRAGALAEASERPGPSGGTTAFVPVGTGVACALVQDGELLDLGPWAGEIGQVRLASGRHRGHRLEEVASAAAVARRAGAPDAHDAATRVRRGDAEAVVAWRDGVAALAEGLAWVAAVSGCRRIVVGGGLALAGDLLFDPLREELGARLDMTLLPEVRAAVHGDRAGAMGAVELARRLLARTAAEGGTP